MNPSRSNHGRATTIVAAAMLSLSLVTCASVASAQSSASAAAVDTALMRPVRVSTQGGSSKMVSAVIDGAVGGQLKWGRFMLAVPPGAWYGRATVTMTVPNPSVLSCDFTIDPPSANGFSVPVMLTVNTPGAPSAKPLVVGWLDPTLGKWVPVRGSWNLRERKLVVAPLYHFSTYGVFVGGKAGW